MTRLKACGVVAVFLGCVVIGMSLVVPPRVMAAAIPLMGGALHGKSNGWPVPAYLKSTHITTTTTFTQVTTTPAVLGCVVIGKAGAASSTIALYNSVSAVAAYQLALIDATQVGQQFCYGMVFSGMLGVAVASGGAAPDFVLTWQGGL